MADEDEVAEGGPGPILEESLFGGMPGKRTMTAARLSGSERKKRMTNIKPRPKPVLKGRAQFDKNLADVKAAEAAEEKAQRRAVRKRTEIHSMGEEDEVEARFRAKDKKAREEEARLAEEEARLAEEESKKAREEVRKAEEAVRKAEAEARKVKKEAEAEAKRVAKQAKEAAERVQKKAEEEARKAKEEADEKAKKKAEENAKKARAEEENKKARADEEAKKKGTASSSTGYSTAASKREYKFLGHIVVRPEDKVGLQMQQNTLEEAYKGNGPTQFSKDDKKDYEDISKDGWKVWKTKDKKLKAELVAAVDRMYRTYVWPHAVRIS
jgi:hypothetical protein